MKTVRIPARPLRTRFIPLMLIAGLLLTSGCSLFPREEEEAPPVLATPVKSEKQVFTVKRGDMVEKVILRGRLAPEQQADLYYPDGGRLKAVYVRGGEEVKTGQVLAELHTEDAEYQAEQARIRFEKAKLALEDARYRAQFSRTEQVANDLKSRELELESARLEHEKWQRSLVESRLIAPFDGLVTAVAAKPGEQVQAYTPVVTVADPSKLWIEADVDDDALSKLAIGQRAILEFSDLEGGQGVGTVVELPDPNARATATNGQPRRIKVRLESGIGKASMGSVGRVHVVLQEKKGVLLLANGAIRQYGGRTYVLLRDPRREVDIVTGIAGELETEVVQGLKEGDEVLGR